MKKIKQARRLVLTSEAIIQLTAPQLQQVAGGGQTLGSNPTACPCSTMISKNC